MRLDHSWHQYLKDRHHHVVERCPLLFKVGEAIVVFLLFFQFVFRRLFVKHSERISQKGEKNCPFSFFDVKGWTVMIFMITFGVTIRHFQLLPNSFISVFYTGLSSALIITGILFLIRAYSSSRHKLKSNS